MEDTNKSFNHPLEEGVFDSDQRGGYTHCQHDMHMAMDEAYLAS